MKTAWIALPILTALVGCAGSVDRANIYEGDWVGDYTDPVRPDTGTMAWLITADGDMTGTITRNIDGEVGDFVGTIDSDGQFMGVAVFPSGGDFESVDGSITYSSSETLGNFHYYFDGDWTTATFTLTPSAAP